MEPCRSETNVQCLSCYLLARVLSFLWFDEHVTLSTVNLAFRDAVQSEFLGKYMLRRILKLLNRPLNGRQVSIHADIGILLKRIASWPTAIDTISLNHPEGPRNVSTMAPDFKINGDMCVIYHGARKENNRSRAFAVVVSDDHFPCLPGTFSQPRFKNEIKSQNQSHIRPAQKDANGKFETQKFITRSMAPFTKTIRLKGLGDINLNDTENISDQVVTLSCIAYFESSIHNPVQNVSITQENSLGEITSTVIGNIDVGPLKPTLTSTSTRPNSSLSVFSSNSSSSSQDSQLQISCIGIACAVFPLRKRRPGFDRNSFGYHGDGKIYHGNRNSIQCAPSFGSGDTVGCGIIYPPLGKHHGKLFFTKNGNLVAILDIGVQGLLSLPWFPAVVSKGIFVILIVTTIAC